MTIMVGFIFTAFAVFFLLASFFALRALWNVIQANGVFIDFLGETDPENDTVHFHAGMHVEEKDGKIIVSPSYRISDDEAQSILMGK